MPVTIMVEGPITTWAQVARLGEWTEELGGAVREVRRVVRGDDVSYRVEVIFAYHAGGVLSHWMDTMPATLADMRALVRGKKE